MPDLYPYAGARLLFTEGVAAARADAVRQRSEPQTPGGPVTIMLAQAMTTAADVATVLLFGNAEQRAITEAWMRQNRERAQ